MPQINIISNSITKTSTDSSEKGSELFLLEFQGKFETNENVSLSGMEVGRLDLSGVIKQIKLYLSKFNSFFDSLCPSHL